MTGSLFTKRFLWKPTSICIIITTRAETAAHLLDSCVFKCQVETLEEKLLTAIKQLEESLRIELAACVNIVSPPITYLETSTCSSGL